jgi:uncharacterized protein (TIGR02145 family)
MKKKLFSLILICIVYASHSQLYTSGSGVTDIDGNTYQTVIINSQEWMAENLKTSKYANGDLIPNITDNTQWINLTTGAWAHYNNDSQYENPYGKFYNWYTVNDPRNLCPAGWHVPTDTEWSAFINYLDPNAAGGNNFSNTAGGKMKSTGTQYWTSPNTDATNESGFSGLPGGARNSDLSIDFTGLGTIGYWWSSTVMNTDNAWGFELGFDIGRAYRDGNGKERGLSVRCIKNSTLGINDINPSSKTVIKVFDILGNETVITPNQLQFYLYSDGSVEKKILTEK